MSPYLLPAATFIAQVTLRTHQLPVLTRFYEQIIGLQVIRHGATKAYLSANGQEPALLILEQQENAPRQNPHQPGLFHVAYLVPNRLELARWWQHLSQTGWPVQGFGDHGVSEAIYLADPDGNGIEIYADRPRSTWPIQNGQVQMTTDPVDVASLLREIPVANKPWGGLAAETRIGHIHLQVSNLNQARQFYHQVLGFVIMQQSYPGALFVAAGGYHHHIGLNTWRSREAAPRNPAATGLASFVIQLPEVADLTHILVRLQEASFHPESLSENYVQVLDKDGIAVILSA